ncbi:MAG TPA: Clp protease N-terminal domain-containing protein, partial [Jatrophihabitantaceae bacterium]|nr:Clp protease N-terminal domain-containing protein [Jatrophihabitantaceae bacterium]
MWGRLTPDGREVVRLAYLEARELGHPGMADEHVLLGLLRHGGAAAELLEDHGIDLATARAELLRVGPTLPSQIDPVGALRTFGI